MFTQALGTWGLRSGLSIFEYVAMFLFTIAVGGLAYIVRYPTELYFGADLNTIRILLIFSLTMMGAVELGQFYVYRWSYFSRGTNWCQILLIAGCVVYLRLIPWDRQLDAEKTKDTIRLLHSTGKMIHTTANVVESENECDILNILRHSTSPSAFVSEEIDSSVNVLQNFIQENYEDATLNIRDVFENVTDTFKYLNHTMLHYKNPNSTTIYLPHILKANFTIHSTMNLTIPFLTDDKSNNLFLHEIRERLRTTYKDIKNSVSVLKKIIVTVKLDLYDKEHGKYQKCLTKIGWVLFHYEAISEKLNSIISTFNDAIHSEDNKAFLHFACFIIFLIAIISFCLLGQGKTVSIYAIMLKRLLIKTFGLILFFLPLINSFGNTFRLLIDTRENVFKSSLHAFNKVIVIY